MSESQRSRPSPSATSLLLAAGREKSIRLAEFGMEAFERGMETMLTGSGDLLRAFLNERPGMAKPFADRLGIRAADLQRCLREGNLDGEPEASANPELGQDRSVVTLPVKEAMKAARDRATAAGRPQWTACEFVAEAITQPESAMRRVLGEIGVSQAALDGAVEWLRGQPDPQGSADDMASRMMKDTREMLYRLMPSTMASLPKIPQLEKYHEEEAAKPLGPKPDLAAKLKEPMPEGFKDREWMFGVVLVREAVRWEARSRNAPEATLEHLLLVLIADGTDTSWFLDRQGIDRTALREELEAASPTFSAGPGYPPYSAPLTLSQPDEPRSSRPFTDLDWVASMFWHEEQPAVRMLRARGVTSNEVKFAVRERISGDREWHLRRPNLAEGLRFTARFSHETKAGRIEAVEEAARYEARQRGNAELSGDHYVFALLTHPTETRAWVASIGIDPDALAQRLDAAMPRTDAAIAFPERGIGLPIGWMEVGIPFTDLAMLRDVLEDRILPRGNSEAAPGLLAEVGIDAERIKAALPPQRPALEVMEEETEALKAKLERPKEE
ncbi:MAG: Clp protease N-terminal domain-containing protein [Fimbriimonas sp.]